MVGGALPCKFIGNFISTYSRMSRDPKQSHRMMGGDIIQHALQEKERDEHRMLCMIHENCSK
jgi:hypothetical protein